jgi:hypothetical protein
VQAEAEQDEALARQTKARELIRELGHLDHTYHLDTGAVQPVEAVRARFEQVWHGLSELAEAADLPTRSRERIAKARRLTVPLCGRAAPLVGPQYLVVAIMWTDPEPH